MAAEACVVETTNYLVILCPMLGILCLHQRPRETPSHGLRQSAQLRQSRPTVVVVCVEVSIHP